MALETDSKYTSVPVSDAGMPSKSVLYPMEQTKDVPSADLGCSNQAILFLRIAAPTAFIQVTILLLSTMSTAYIGQNIGRHGLTGFSVAALAANLLGNSIIFGMLNGMETLAPQAMGSGNYAEVGYLAQTSLVLCSGLSIFIVLIFWNAESILVFLEQPEESVELASSFLRIVSFNLPSEILYNVIRRFLWCQDIVAPFMVIGVLVLLCHVVYLRLFINFFQMQFAGAAMAHVASSYTQLIFVAVYFKCYTHYNPVTWSGLSWVEALNWDRVKRCLVLGIPGILSNNEWWYWEVVCVFAGRLGELSLASHTIAYNLVPLAFMLPLGLAIGVTTRIGTLLAQQRVAAARMVAIGAVCGGLIAGSFTASMAYLFRDNLIRAFAGQDEEVFKTAESIWMYVCGFLVLDALNGTIAGVYRGLGAQIKLSLVMFCCLWVIGIPGMYLWTFKYARGIVGIWQVMCGLYCMLVILLLLVCMKAIDWTKVVQVLDTPQETL